MTPILICLAVAALAWILWRRAHIERYRIGPYFDPGDAEANVTLGGENDD